MIGTNTVKKNLGRKFLWFAEPPQIFCPALCFKFLQIRQLLFVNKKNQVNMKISLQPKPDLKQRDKRQNQTKQQFKPSVKIIIIFISRLETRLMFCTSVYKIHNSISPNLSQIPYQLWVHYLIHKFGSNYYFQSDIEKVKYTTNQFVYLSPLENKFNSWDLR